MLSSDLTLVSNRASQTLPGSDASEVFSQITAGQNTDTTVRRNAAAALTTPTTISIAHQLRGKGYSQRVASLLKFHYRDLTADPDDTGGVVPECTWNLTLNRPVNSSGAITDAIVKTMLGQLMDLLLQSGNLDKFLNTEG